MLYAFTLFRKRNNWWFQGREMKKAIFGHIWSDQIYKMLLQTLYDEGERGRGGSTVHIFKYENPKAEENIKYWMYRIQFL
jgi:hypothetical protein